MPRRSRNAPTWCSVTNQLPSAGRAAPCQSEPAGHEESRGARRLLQRRPRRSGSSDGRSASTPASPLSLSRAKWRASSERGVRPHGAAAGGGHRRDGLGHVRTAAGHEAGRPVADEAAERVGDGARPAQPDQRARQVQPPDGGALRLAGHVARRDGHAERPAAARPSRPCAPGAPRRARRRAPR